MIAPPYVAPSRGMSAAVQNLLANARLLKQLRRATIGRMRFVTLESDVRDIVYASWVIPADRAERLVPPGVRIRRAGDWTLLTVLTYAHGHFGPALAGPMRRLFPSPIQSNWRLYVEAIDDVAPAVPTVLFLANSFDSMAYALGTRIFSDAMLGHHAAKLVHAHADGGWTIRMGGGGSAPVLDLYAMETQERVLPPAFQRFFSSHDDALQQLCMQDAAIAAVADNHSLALAGIELPIYTRTAVPMTPGLYVPGDLLRALGATAAPFCFRIPAVRFRAVSEALIRTARHAG